MIVLRKSTGSTLWLTSLGYSKHLNLPTTYSLEDELVVQSPLDEQVSRDLIPLNTSPRR